jgi:hypothetical protein
MLTVSVAVNHSLLEIDMKLKILSAILGATLGSRAMAAAISLPIGPIYFPFTNLEQTALGVGADGAPINNTNNCAGCSGAAEGNWGVAQVSIMRVGSINPSGTTAGVIGNDINNSGTAPFFADQILPTLGGQVTAMFHGAVNFGNTVTGTVNSLQSTRGYIDLYWDDPTLANTIVNINTLTPGMRTGDASFTGITDGSFLGRLAFASGINPGNANVDI